MPVCRFRPNFRTFFHFFLTFLFETWVWSHQCFAVSLSYGTFLWWQVLGVILNNKENFRQMAHLFVSLNAHWVNNNTYMVQICPTSNAIRVHAKMEQELVLKTLAPNVQKRRCCWRKIIFDSIMQNKNPLL